MKRLAILLTITLFLCLIASQCYAAARTLVGTGPLSASTDANWNGGTAIADGDSITIASDQILNWDKDTAAWTTGIAGITLSGTSGHPCALVLGSSAFSGMLPIKAACNIAGTGAADYNWIVANDEGTIAGTTVLRAANSGVIEFLGTNAGKIVGQYLRFNLRRTKPAHDYVRVYGTLYTAWVGSAANDTLTLASHGIADTTPVCCRSVGGTLPAPLLEDRLYYVVNKTTDTIKLAYTSGGAAIDLTTDGTGTIQAWTGHSNTSTDTVNVLDDVTGDLWTVGDNAVLVNAGPQTYDQQRVTLAAIATGTMQLSANVDSAQSPLARIYRVKSNVEVLSNTTGSSVPIFDLTSATASGDVISCSIRALAGTGTTFYGYGVSAATGHTIDALICGASAAVNGCVTVTHSGVSSACSYGIAGCVGATNSGTIAAVAAAASLSCTGFDNTGLIFGSYSAINRTGYGIGLDCNNYGTILGCYRGFDGCSSGNDSGVIANCYYKYLSSNVVVMQNATGVCGTDSGTSTVRGYGAGFYSPTQVSTHIYPYSGSVILYDVADANNTPQPGYLKAWTPGGTTVSYAYSAGTHGTPPVSLPIIHESTYETALANNFVEWEINGSSGLAITATLYAKSSATGMTVRPTIAICSPRYPRWNATGVLASGTAADNTNWQTVTATYTPTADGPLVVRVYGANVSGTTYWWQQTRIKASAFTNAVPLNIRKGKTIDDVSGTYVGHPLVNP